MCSTFSSFQRHSRELLLILSSPYRQAHVNQIEKELEEQYRLINNLATLFEYYSPFIC